MNTENTMSKTAKTAAAHDWSRSMRCRRRAPRRRAQRPRRAAADRRGFQAHEAHAAGEDRPPRARPVAGGIRGALSDSARHASRDMRSWRRREPTPPPAPRARSIIGRFPNKRLMSSSFVYVRGSIQVGEYFSKTSDVEADGEPTEPSRGRRAYPAPFASFSSGRSSSEIARQAAPSRSSNWPVFIAHRKPARPRPPSASASGTR